MKKLAYLPLLLLCLNSFLGEAQTYYPLPDSNALWNMSWGVSGCLSPYYVTAYNYTITGDTLIGAFNYHKLKVTGVFNCGGPGVSTQPVGIAGGNPGSYRNDTLAKKIYYFPKDSTHESLLYDFNLVAGDTIKGYMNDLAILSFGSTYFAVIDSVDSVLIDGNYRKRWYYNTSTYLSYAGQIIEGIGNTQDLIVGLLSGFDDNGVLVCYSENNTTLYPASSVGDSCPLITNIINLNTIKNDVKVYPNPSNGHFYIAYNIAGMQQGLFVLKDITGKEIVSKVLTNNSDKMNINQKIMPGIYLYQIMVNHETYDAGKIIITR